MTATSALPNFFFGIHMCVYGMYMIICMYVVTCVYIHVRECLWRPEVDVGGLHQSTLLIHAGSWLNLDPPPFLDTVSCQFAPKILFLSPKC